jgi:hypothetical protein
LVLKFDTLACSKCHFSQIAGHPGCHLQNLPHRCTASGTSRKVTMMFNLIKGMQNAEK